VSRSSDYSEVTCLAREVYWLVTSRFYRRPMPVAASKRCRTYRFRLHPTVRQSRVLKSQPDLQCELYNAALEERIGAWAWEQRRVTYVEQTRMLKSLRGVRPEVLACGTTLCRGTLKRLDRAMAGYFGRLRRGDTPGFPRFRSEQRWDSMQWEDTAGWKLTDSHRLRLLGIGEIKMNYYRPITGTPKAITVKREGKKWWVSVRCVDVPAQPLPATGREVGVDLGVVNLVAMSEGEPQQGERFGGRAKQQLSEARRRLSRKQRGSNRRRRQVEVVAHRTSDATRPISSAVAWSTSTTSSCWKTCL
jgi:putative transposase